MSAEYTGRELLKECKLKELKYLAVGTGRCGTVYFAKLLSSVGLPCTHEAIFNHDGLEAALDRIAGTKPIEVSLISKLASISDESHGVSWFRGREREEIVAESSYMASPYLDHPSLDNVTVIHLVRHPMRVINSFVAGFQYFNDWCLTAKDYEEYHKFIYQFVPELVERPMEPVTRCALYWIRWNQMIERKAKGKRYFLFRVEQMPDKLFKFLNLDSPTSYYKNRKSNEKVGVGETYTHFDQIPDGPVKKELLTMYNRYYNVSFI
jgi:hypothetical protein